mgnify:CR=1 FL=1
MLIISPIGSQVMISTPKSYYHITSGYWLILQYTNHFTLTTYRKSCINVNTDVTHSYDETSNGCVYGNVKVIMEWKGICVKKGMVEKYSVMYKAL